MKGSISQTIKYTKRKWRRVNPSNYIIRWFPVKKVIYSHMAIVLQVEAAARPGYILKLLCEETTY